MKFKKKRIDLNLTKLKEDEEKYHKTLHFTKYSRNIRHTPKKPNSVEPKILSGKLTYICYMTDHFTK